MGWAGPVVRARQLELIGLHVDWTLAEQRPDRLHGPLEEGEPLPGRAELVAERLELGLIPTGADPKVEPAARQ